MRRILLAGDELRGLYVSDVQVDALLRRPRARVGDPLPDVNALTAEAERLRAETECSISDPFAATPFGDALRVG